MRYASYFSNFWNLDAESYGLYLKVADYIFDIQSDDDRSKLIGDFEVSYDYGETYQRENIFPLANIKLKGKNIIFVSIIRGEYLIHIISYFGGLIAAA